MTVILSIVSAIVFVANYWINFLSTKATIVMAFGVVFWLGMSYAYQAEWKARLEADDEIT